MFYFFIAFLMKRYFKGIINTDMVVHTFNASAWEVEAGNVCEF